MKQVGRNAFYKLRLPYAGRPDKNERYRAPLCGNTDPLASYRGGDRLNRLILADYVLLQPCVQTGELLTQSQR